jgi:hypothetical protein
MRNLEILTIAMLVVLPAGWSGEFNHSLYTQTTLQDIITAEEQNQSPDQAEAVNCADCIQLECEVNKYQVPCSYSNILRPISEKKKNVIILWMETLQIDLKLASLYQQEIQVKEGMRVHWIPMQEQIIPHIKTELVKNDTIELFIIFIGRAESEFVFIATEFEKPIAPMKNSLQTTMRAAP